MYLTDKGKHLLRMRTEKEFSSKWTLKAGMNSHIFIYDKQVSNQNWSEQTQKATSYS
jgi:hypothetical protein